MTNDRTNNKDTNKPNCTAQTTHCGEFPLTKQRTINITDDQKGTETKEKIFLQKKHKCKKNNPEMWITKKKHPSLFAKLFPQSYRVQFVVRRNFDSMIPIKALTMRAKEDSTIGVRIFYVNAGWDETLIDTAKTTEAKYFSLQKHEQLLIPFDTALNEFSVSIISDVDHDVLEVEMFPVVEDYASIFWMLHPRVATDYLYSSDPKHYA